MQKLKAFLTRKIGPLPAWAYLLVLVGLALVYRFWKARQQNAADSTADTTTADVQPTISDSGISDGSIPQGGGMSDNGTSGASLDQSALQNEIDQLWDILNNPGASGDPGGDGSGGGKEPQPGKEKPPQGSHPDYGATHPPPNNKPGFWWNMSGKETWVTADMKSQWLAYLQRTGTKPGDWARNHPPAAAIMGIAPTPVPTSKPPSPAVKKAAKKKPTGRTALRSKPPVRRAKTVASHQGSKGGATHSPAILPPLAGRPDSTPGGHGGT